MDDYEVVAPRFTYPKKTNTNNNPQTTTTDSRVDYQDTSSPTNKEHIIDDNTHDYDEPSLDTIDDNTKVGGIIEYIKKNKAMIITGIIITIVIILLIYYYYTKNNTEETIRQPPFRAPDLDNYTRGFNNINLPPVIPIVPHIPKEVIRNIPVVQQPVSADISIEQLENMIRIKRESDTNIVVVKNTDQNKEVEDNSDDNIEEIVLEDNNNENTNNDAVEPSNSVDVNE